MRLARCGALAVAAVLVVGLTSAASGQPLEVLNDNRRISIHGAGQMLFLRVKSGSVESVTITVLDIGGGAVAPDRVQFRAPAGPYGEGRVVAVPIDIDRKAFPGPSLDLIGRVDGRAEGNELSPITFTLTMTGSEVQLQPASTPVTLALRRNAPFTRVTAQHCVALQATPRWPLVAPVVQGSELQAGPSEAKVVVPGSFVQARLAPCPIATSANSTPTAPMLVLDTVLSGGVTSASGTVRLVGGDIKPESVVALNIVSKDALIYPLLVIAFATLLSRWTHAWVEKRRAARVNDALMSELNDDLYNAPLIQPGIEQREEFRHVRQLLVKATRLRDRGDTDAVALTLNDAREKLDALLGTGIPQPGFERVSRAPTVVVNTRPADLTTGRVVTFSIAGDLPDDVAIVWLVRQDDQWVPLDAVVDSQVPPPGRQVTTRTPFDAPGLHSVRAIVGNSELAPANFRIAPSTPSVMWADIRRRDRIVEGLAFVIAILVSTAAIAELASFGTFKDYVVQFAAAFGITEGVKGFSQVLGAVRRA